MLPLKIGFVIDPIERINPKKDSTVALMYNAQERGWDVYMMTLNDLELTTKTSLGKLSRITLNLEHKNWFEIEETLHCDLLYLDVIFMRKDPPFNMSYIIATYILEKAEKDGVLVVNRPAALRSANEKIVLTNFPECAPPSLVTRSKTSILKFIDTNEQIVLKPLDKMGGESVYVIKKEDPNKAVIIEDLTNHQTQHVMAQRYLPEIESFGDKRILLIDGEPVEYGIVRKPQNGDHRGNMAVGGKALGFKLSERDMWLCSKIKEEIKIKGLFFVGIDVIGDYITEINVTSPTGIQEIDNAYGINVSNLVLDALGRLYQQHMDKPSN